MMRYMVLLFGLSSFTFACQAGEMPPGVHEMGCVNCHAMDHKVVGPAWLDIAQRYRAARGSQEVVDQLVKKVSKGGEGNWGDVPMVPSDPLGVKHGQIVQLVKFVLALSDDLPKKQEK